jgi:hypothetical protein
VSYVLQKFEGGMHYVMLDEEEALFFLGKEVRRVICLMNGRCEFRAAIMKRRGGGYYINVGSQVREQLGIRQGDGVTLSLKEDLTDYQFDMPEELLNVLEADSEAAKLFSELTPGRQRSLGYLVKAVSTVNKRVERAFTIAEKLKQGISNPREILRKQ